MFRLLTKVTLRTGAELNSDVISTLRLGCLVRVLDVRQVRWHASASTTLRLNVQQCESSAQPSPAAGGGGLTGWISGYGDLGEPLLDLRDQLEYKRYLDAEEDKQRQTAERHVDRFGRTPGTSTAARPWQQYSVCLQREGDDRALGLTVDLADGRTLEIREVDPDSVVSDWNASCAPGDALAVGDRIVCVNGASGAAQALLRAMAASPRLEMILQRRWSSAQRAPSSQFSDAPEVEDDTGPADLVPPPAPEGGWAQQRAPPAAWPSAAPPTFFEEEIRIQAIDPRPKGGGVFGGESLRANAKEEEDWVKFKARVKRNMDAEWRPVGVCVEDVPDSKLFVDYPGIALCKDEACGEWGQCRPCREDELGLFPSWLSCAATVRGAPQPHRHSGILTGPSIYAPFLPTDAAAALGEPAPEPKPTTPRAAWAGSPGLAEREGL